MEVWGLPVAMKTFQELIHGFGTMVEIHAKGCLNCLVNSILKMKINITSLYYVFSPCWLLVCIADGIIREHSSAKSCLMNPHTAALCSRQAHGQHHHLAYWKYRYFLDTWKPIIIFSQWIWKVFEIPQAVSKRFKNLRTINLTVPHPPKFLS